MKIAWIFALSCFLLGTSCSRESTSNRAPEPEVDEPLIPIFQRLLTVPTERSVTIDAGKDNERTLVVRSRFPTKRSEHGSGDGSSSIAFIDYEFTPHREGEPYTQLRDEDSYLQLKDFYFRIGNHAGGKGFSSEEDLVEKEYPDLDSHYLQTFSDEPYRILVVDLGTTRHYFHKIANHRSLEIVIKSNVPLKELSPEIQSELDSTLSNFEIREKH